MQVIPKNPRRALAALILLGIVGVLGFLVVRHDRARAGEIPDTWTGDDEPKQRAAHAELEGKPMPPLDLSGWINGEVKPQDMSGKVVLLDIYATWCGPCLAEIPHNNEMFEKYKARGLVLIGVCTDNEGQDKMEQVAKEKGMEYPTARDASLKTRDAWRALYFPTYAIVDRNGIVRKIGLQPDDLEKAVQKLLAEKPATTAPAPASAPPTN